ncbi:MAG TPA: hypothetical protein VK142_04580, partial [Bacillota bacterium]|nr:hypothetical protein [Bacillota bacterium]
MDRTIRIVTYSTIAIVFILPIILFIRSGWDAALFLLYYILGVTGCMIVFKVLSLYLPAVWAFIIIGGCFIIAMHMIIQSWVFTVLVTLLVAGLIFVYFMGWHKMLTYIFVGGIIALLTYAIEFDGFHEVLEVSESA